MHRVRCCRSPNSVCCCYKNQYAVISTSAQSRARQRFSLPTTKPKISRADKYFPLPLDAPLVPPKQKAWGQEAASRNGLKRAISDQLPEPSASQQALRSGNDAPTSRSQIARKPHTSLRDGTAARADEQPIGSSTRQKSLRNGGDRTNRLVSDINNSNNSKNRFLRSAGAATSKRDREADVLLLEPDPAREIELQALAASVRGLITSQNVQSRDRPAQNDYGNIFPFIPAHLSNHLTLRQSHAHQVRALWDCVSDILPRDLLNPSIGDLSKGERASLIRTHSVFSAGCLPMGWHHLMFNPSIVPAKLCSDGTDTRFLPGPATDWPFRLWAGGSIHQASHKALPYGKTFLHCIETPTSVKTSFIKPQQVLALNPDLATVSISKQIYDTGHQIDQKKDYTDNQAMIKFFTDPVTYSESHRAKSFPLIRKQISGPILTETYDLVFSQDKPSIFSRLLDPRTASKLFFSRASIKPKFVHQLRVSFTHLFLWSSVTQNAHKIHLDRDFTRSVYGAPNLLVQGPFLLFLALEHTRRTLTTYSIERGLGKFSIVGIDYKIYQPCYVDEKLTINLKPRRFPQPGTLGREWIVWIVKENQQDNESTAFRGFIQLRLETGLPEGEEVKWPPEARTDLLNLDRALGRKEVDADLDVDMTVAPNDSGRNVGRNSLAKSLQTSQTNGPAQNERKIARKQNSSKGGSQSAQLDESSEQERKSEEKRSLSPQAAQQEGDTFKNSFFDQI